MGIEVIIGFASGIGVSLIGALASAYFQRRNENRRDREHTRFKVYMQLMELKSLYWRIEQAEFHNRQIEEKDRQRVRDKTWQIADLLREADDIEHLESILHVMFSEQYATAKARSEAMQSFVQELGKLVNPRYARAIDSIGGRNILEFDPNRAAKTPGTYL